jgi:hypothetical protein
MHILILEEFRFYSNCILRDEVKEARNDDDASCNHLTEYPKTIFVHGEYEDLISIICYAKSISHLSCYGFKNVS